jgi:hypothetical protein
LTGVDLVLSGDYVPKLGDGFVIVNNDGTEDVIGTFNGLDDLEVFTIASGPREGDYQINYHGGDGNDVVIAAINVAPSFEIGGGLPTFTDESGPLVIAFANSISAGPPKEVQQKLTFVVLSNSNPGLFAAGPEIDEEGNLRFTPAFNVAGSAQITIALKDDGGTVSGGSDASEPVTFTITIGKEHPWHNSALALDVRGAETIAPDGHVDPGDVLAVINYINAFDSKIPADAAIGTPFGFLDVDGDDEVTAGDALTIINAINSGVAGEGEDSREAEVGIVEPNNTDDLLKLLAFDIASQPRRRTR